MLSTPCLKHAPASDRTPLHLMQNNAIADASVCDWVYNGFEGSPREVPGIYRLEGAAWRKQCQLAS